MSNDPLGLVTFYCNKDGPDYTVRYNEKDFSYFYSTLSPTLDAHKDEARHTEWLYEVLDLILPLELL